jgi:hypothetical protein
MARNYIDFISAYCDTWCERCSFTERCSHFAVTSALAMCDDDMSAAIELAIGAPRVPGEKPQQKIADRMAEALDGYDEPTKEELNQIGCEMEERRQRVERHVLAEASYDYAVAGGRWFEKHDSQIENTALSAAVEIIQRDMFLIHVKIVRALTGRDEDPKGSIWKSRVQNDWNGSAKVALISIERSERAWRDIAGTLADEAATVLADSLARLRSEVTREFPRAMEFRRPGFDDARRT